MMVDDAGVADGYFESIAKHRRDSNDGVGLFGSHLIATNVKIADVLDTDSTRVMSGDASRGGVQRSSGDNHAVGEDGEMLTDV